MKLARTFLYFLLISFICISNLQAVSLPEDHIIIVDAGSSGTRLFLYQYEYKEKAKNNLPQIKLIKKTSVTPGIVNQKSINDPVSLTPYFEQLFNQIDEQLTTTEKNQTPIYFYATGGIRELPTFQQQTLMNNVSNTLVKIILGKNYKLPGNISKDIRLISGSEEALFNWLTINYLTKSLSNSAVSDNNTFPSVELGGSSTQIGFLPAANPSLNKMAFNLNNKELDIYAYSYDNFGIEATLNHLIESDQLSANTDLSPCFPVDSHYPLNKPVVTKGSGNFDACTGFLQNYAFVKMKQQSCLFNNKTCSLMGIYQPLLPQKTIYGTGNYYNILKILGLADKPVTLDQIKDQGQKYCATAWNDIKKQHTNTAENYLINYCFGTAWIHTLLTGFGMSQNQQFIAVNNIANTDTSWTLGSVISLLTQ